MNFRIDFATAVESQAALADVTIYGPQGLLTPKLEMAPSGKTSTRFVELAAGRIELTLEIQFRTWSNKVFVGLSGLIHGLSIHQISPTFVLANAYHGELAPTDQCTVTCVATGESRTGRNVCIECGSPQGTIKICC